MFRVSAFRSAKDLSMKFIGLTPVIEQRPLSREINCTGGNTGEVWFKVSRSYAEQFGLGQLMLVTFEAAAE